MRKLFSNLCFGVAALVMLYTAVALGNYSATQGSGTTFGSIVNGGVHYVQQMICDATTPSQCAAVNSSGAVSVVATGVAQGSTTSGQTQSLVGCAVTTSAPSYTTAQTSPCSLDTAGNLRVSNLTAIPAGANLIGKFGIDQTTPGTTNGVQVNAALPAGSNLIGKTGVDQTTPGTTNGVSLAQIGSTTVDGNSGNKSAGTQRVVLATDQPSMTNAQPINLTQQAGANLPKGGVGVVNGGSFYQAVAASQTATVLQSSAGATGDYLSHCDIYPTSTSPGVVTVFDNTNSAANSAILFPGGASSLSNLVPFSVPVGAVSVNGAWKVTTGSAVSVVCYGKFS